MKRFLNSALLRAYATGAAGLLDIFGSRARVVRFGTLAGDARRLHGDLRTVGKDFESILSRKKSGDLDD